MINKAILFIVLHMFAVNLLVAQNLKESLGGVQTNFKIVSDTVDLNVSDQIIILKAEKKHQTDAVFSYAWGYGYQSFHLEFITKESLKVETFKYKAGRDNESKLELTFYDPDNNLIASASIPFDDVDVYNNPSTVGNASFYSIDLIDIPLVLLDKTAKIDLTKKVASR